MKTNRLLLVLFLLTCFCAFPLVHSVDALNVNESTSMVNGTTDIPSKIVDAENSNFNASTETPSSPPVSSTTITSTTTTTAQVDTTTMKPTTKPTKGPVKSSTNNRRVCSCDLHIKSCDMNCCCDVDCSKEEKTVFQFCIDSEFYEPHVGAHHSHNSHSCFRSQIFYRENSPDYIEEARGGMFCVVTDNVNHVDQLEQEPKNVDLKILTNKKLKFSWDIMRQMQDISWEPYRYGSYLLQVKTKMQSVQRVLPFGFPSSIYSKQCSATEYIKFLQPIQTKCKIQIKDLKSLCIGNSQLNINTFLNNTTFISNPSSVNITESIVPLTMGLCSSSHDGSRICRPIPSFNEPTWNEESSSCFNILENLELTFIHSGIEGLSKVVAKVQLGDYNSSSRPKEITQEFSTNFFWRTNSTPSEEDINSTMITEKEKQEGKDFLHWDWPRSGNPGYILGKPIVMGVAQVEKVKEGRKQTDSKGTGKEEVNKEDRDYEEESSETGPSSDKGTMKPPEKRGISLDRDPKKWMTIHGPGVCSLSMDRRLNVLFGMGHQSECLLNIANYSTCNALQLDIVKILYGVSSETDSLERYVAAFGNPDLDDMNDWVLANGFLSLPTTLGKGASDSVNNHGCDQVVSTMTIKIAYAYVGPVSFPQAKIVGVLYEFGESYNIPKQLRCPNEDTDCKSYQHQARVATTVIFIDATKAPTPKIGQWPVVSIKLPQDFFYPFATSSTSRVSLSKVFVSFWILLYMYKFLNI